MYQALYRKYRPNTFEEVVGQNIVKKTFENSIKNNKITHAYLFTGPRGTGKTSIAKILAKTVNCENLDNITPCNKCVSCTQIINKQNTDIIEIDAASNNGVDEIREIREKVNLVPSFGKYKVYIIDEVHMLTTAAFNALLKTLEEPPKHIIFILATTEPHKIPSTILSRCQRFDFKKISVSDIKKKIKEICTLEKIEIDDLAIETIAKLSDGGMRDSLSLLDQLTSYTSEKIMPNDVIEVYGVLTTKEISDFLKFVLEKKIDKIFETIDEYNNDGKNIIKIMELMIEFLKNILIYFNCSDFFTDNEQKNIYNDFCSLVEENKVYKIIEILLDSIKLSKTSNNLKLIFELAIIKIIKLEENINMEIKQVQTNIQIYEEKKEIKNENKIEQNQISNEILEKVNKLKKIRINNTLSMFNKKELIIFKEKFDNIKELLMDPEYSSIVSLMLDGEIKAKGGKNLIFVFNTKNLDEYFNSNLPLIEKILKTTFSEDLKPIAISTDSWEIIKKEFNDNLKQNKNPYKYIEEIDELNNLNKEEKNQNNNNEIDEIFEELVVYN